MLSNANMKAIQTVSVGAGGVASIDFTSIPQTYTDLYILVSARSNQSFVSDDMYISINGSTANLDWKRMYATSSASPGVDGGTTNLIGATNGANSTASIFGNTRIYIPSYTGSQAKTLMSDHITENNATRGDNYIFTTRWNQTSAITSLSLLPTAGLWVQHTSATLYGITSVGTAAKATGGIITEDDTYFYHLFTSSGTFTPLQSLSAQVLAAGGGGGGGGNIAGGGGAGELELFSGNTVSLTASAYTVTVGGQGAGGATNTQGSDGTSSSFSGSGITTITALGGGGGGAGGGTFTGRAGGSGGGGGASGGGAAGGAANGSNTNIGGTGYYGPYPAYAAGGGGGATAAGASGGSGTSNGGNGGQGYSLSSIATHLTNILSPMTVICSGGGGCGENPNNGAATAGTGGTGAGNGGSVSTTPTNATSYGSGGGGGRWESRAGSGVGGNGFAGVVIVRYAK